MHNSKPFQAVLTMHLYACAIILRNSAQLVEAAFDGDLEEVKNHLDKGERKDVPSALLLCLAVIMRSVILSYDLLHLCLYFLF